jgi:hypothetical protein
MGINKISDIFLILAIKESVMMSVKETRAKRSIIVYPTWKGGF